MNDKSLTLRERLKNFEAHQQEQGDDYGAEVLYRAWQRFERIDDILDDPFPKSIYPQLSPLERDIAKMTVIDGMTAQEISEALGSPKGTVNTYLRMVYKAFGVRREKWASIVFDRIREVLKDG